MVNDCADGSNAKVREWLDKTSIRGTPMRERLSYLLACNGGKLTVTSWGFIGCNDAGHQVGLEQDEALELIYLSGFIDGLAMVGVDVFEHHKKYFHEYARKHGFLD